MALAYRTSVVGGNAVSGTSPTGVITPVVSDLFLVVCQAIGNVNAAPTCSDGNTGGTYTLLWTALNNTSTNMLSCFVRDNLLVNTTSTTVTVACGAHTAVEIAVIAISGGLVAGAAAIAQSATQANQAGGGHPSTTFSSAASYTDLIVSVTGCLNNPPGIVPPTGSSPTWTTRQNVGRTGCGLQVITANQFNGTNVLWGISTSAFAAGSVEVTIPPSAGVDAAKLVAYAAGGAPVGADASKLVAYAALTSINTNPPVWPAFAMPSGYVGNPYSIGWDLYPAASPTTFTVVAGAIPPGLTLNSGPFDQGSITGTPTTLGTYPFTLRASNAYGTADHAFSIVITVPAGAGGAYVFFA